MHGGIYEYHSRPQSMTNHKFHARYFWPTMEADYHEFVKKCVPFQKYDNLTHIKQEELYHVYSP